jgi:DHA1 family tetracycline resistance protein-like MFS transporter
MAQDVVPMRQMQGSRPRLAFILITVFLDMAGFGMVAPLLPLYVQHHFGGALLAGALGSVYAVMQALGAPLIGSIADRHGRKPVLVACLLGSSMAYLGVAFTRSLAELFAAVAFGGLMGGSFATAQAYITDGSAPSERTRWLGLAGAAVGLGMAVGPLLGGFLGAHGLKMPAFAAGGIALANALYGIFIIRDFRRPGGPMTAERENLRINPVRGIIDVFRRPELRPFLFTLAALNLSFSGLPSTFPLFSQARFGWTPPDNGLFFTFIGACAVLTQGFLVGRIAPRVGEARLASVGAAMVMAAFPLAAIAPAGWMLYPLLGLVAVGTGLGIPTLMSLVAHSAPSAGVGRVMGGVQSVLSACMIAGPALAGAAHQTFGPPAPYWMGGGFAAAALVIVLLSRRRVVSAL